MKENKIKLLKEIYIISVVVLILWVFNWQTPVITFENPILNDLFVLLVLFIPMILIILNFLIFKNPYVKMSLSLLFAIPCLMGLMFNLVVFLNTVDTCKYGYDPSFEPIHKMHLNTYQVSIYRTDEGAMTSFGIVARQEKIIFPGILLVKDIFSAYPRDDVTYGIVSNNTVLIDGKEILLKENVYF